MRIHLYLKSQDPSSGVPAHVIAAPLAAKICERKSVNQFFDEKGRLKAIQLKTCELFAEIKKELSPIKSKDAIKLPVREWNEPLLLTYPLADQRTFPAY
jgi:hypothetical protein